MNLNSNELTVNQSATEATFSGIISGSTATSHLTKAGSGTLILAGNNTYQGTTSVNAGVLKVSGDVNNNSNVSIASGATFSISASQPQTYTGVISGSGVFRKEGSGTLTLSGASSPVSYTHLTLPTIE